MPESTKVGAIHYDLDLQDTQFKKKVDEANLSMQGLVNSFKKAEEGSQLLLGTIAGLGAGIIAFGLQSVGAYRESEVAQAQLEHAVIGVTKATRAQLEATEYLAERIAYKGVLDDDTVKTGIAQLSTFGLTNKAVQGLAQSMADLTVNQFGINASGDQAAQAANMVAKALNGQFGVLEKSGIRFTQAQIKTIKYGKEMEKVRAINEGFAQNLKFTNEVARQTGDGLDANLRVKLGNIQEEFGGLIDNAMLPFKEQLSELFDDIMNGVNEGGPLSYFEQLLKDSEKTLYAVAGAIVIALVPALYSAAVGVWAVIGPLIPFLAIGALIGLMIQKIVENMGGWNAIMLQLQPTLTVLGFIFQNMILPFLVSIWTQIMTQLVPALKSLWDQIGPILIPILKILGVVLGVIIITAITAVIAAIKLIIGIFSLAANAVTLFIKGIKVAVQFLASAFSPVIGWIGSALKGVGAAILKPFTDAFDNLKGMLDNIKKKIADSLNPFVRHSPSLVDWVNKGTKEMTESYEDMFDRLGSVSAQNKMNLTGATQSAIGMNPGGKLGTSGNTVIQVTINPKGIIARSQGEMRDIAVELASLVNQALQATGPKPKIIQPY